MILLLSTTCMTVLYEANLKQVRGGHAVLGNVQHVVRPVDGQAHRLPRPSLRLDSLVDADQLRSEIVPSLPTKVQQTAINFHRPVQQQEESVPCQPLE